MILALASLGITIVALGTMGVIVARHWNEMRLLDPTSVKSEQQRRQRYHLIEQRLQRLTSDRLEPLYRLSRRVRVLAERQARHWEARLYAFERMYRRVQSPLAAMSPSVRERVQSLMSEGKSLARDQKWVDAERRFLEVLSLNTHHIEAYKGLGQIYLKQKLYPQARETFDFVLKIRKNDDAAFSALADIAEAEGDVAQAESLHLKAVAAAPKQAQHQASLATFYLDREQAAKAKPFAVRASELEPSSPKYTELCLATAVALQDVAESRHRYQRLRLLTDDANKLQAWKKKVETLEQSPT